MRRLGVSFKIKEKKVSLWLSDNITCRPRWGRGKPDPAEGEGGLGLPVILEPQEHLSVKDICDVGLVVGRVLALNLNQQGVVLSGGGGRGGGRKTTCCCASCRRGGWGRGEAGQGLGRDVSCWAPHRDYGGRAR